MDRLDVIKSASRRIIVRQKLRSDLSLAADNLHPKRLAHRWTQAQISKITQKAHGAQGIAGGFVKDNMAWIVSGALGGLLIASYQPLSKLSRKLRRKD